MPTLAQRARLAYAQGWALSGGPMTDRVRAGCVAAMGLAETHTGDDESLIEVTLHLGQLEGNWATVFADREKVHEEHGPAITNAYRALMAAALDIPAEVARFRRELETSPRQPGEDPAELYRTLAGVASVRIAHAAAAPAEPAYQLAVQTIGDGIAAAETAGRAAAQLIAGRTAEATRSDSDHNAVAAVALGQMVNGTATDIEDDLVDLAGSGATADEMQAAIEDDTSGERDRSSVAYGDLALGQSFGQGMVATMVVLGLRKVNFVTAGTRVCSTCEDYEAQNPWALLEVPVPAIHPHCACVLEPA
ncbi:MAG: hypothetical protein JWO67_3204 [Streptosporangiaceae bacterium]|nr:hypothetical protein [Streptosporangiaceae bacterium]